MRCLFSRRAGIAAAIAILLASLVPLSQPYRHAAAWRVPAHQQSLVDRTLKARSAASGVSPEEYRGFTRPRVSYDRHQTCVTLRSHRNDGGGSYSRCYHNRTGALLSEAEMGIPFGRESLWNRFGAALW